MYNGIPNLRSNKEKIEYTEEMVQQMTTFKNDIVAFLDFVKRTCVYLSVHGAYEFSECQKQFLRNVENEKKVLYVNSRQLGMSTILAIKIVHELIFDNKKNIFLISNNNDNNKTLIQTVQKIYSSLPLWMQREVSSWNKNSLRAGTNFLNSAFNVSGVKGYTISSLYIDNAAFISDVNFDSIYDCCLPTTLSIKNSNVVIMSSSNPGSSFNNLAKKCKDNQTNFKYHELKYYEREERGAEWKLETLTNIGQRAFDIEYNCVLD